jgi:general secretion pathway protein C
MAVDKLLKRHFWAVILVLVAIAAFLDAQGIMQVVGSNLAPDEAQLSTPPLMQHSAPGSGTASPHSTSAEAILARNAFDSVTGPLDRQAAAAADDSAEAPPPDLTDPFEAPECDGMRVLIIAASPDPDWSFAALETQTDKGKSFLRRRGGEVGGKTVCGIGWNRVWLSAAAQCKSQICQVRMFKPAPLASASASAPPPPAPMPAGGGATPVSDDIKKGIQRVGPNEFNVDRSVVDKILENQAELMRQARIVPETDPTTGKVAGIRLFGVRNDTLLGVLGMENGDRLEKINGFDMTSPEKALEAYARLRTADHLTIAMQRKGSEMNLDYNIK